MKSILLLAAVYSLIFHQWYKEKGTLLANTQPMKANPTYVNKQSKDLSLSGKIPFVAFYAVLKLNR